MGEHTRELRLDTNYATLSRLARHGLVESAGELKARGPTATAYDVIATDFAIAHLDADLRWLQASLDRVADREVHS